MSRGSATAAATTRDVRRAAVSRVAAAGPVVGRSSHGVTVADSPRSGWAMRAGAITGVHLPGC